MPCNRLEFGSEFFCLVWGAYLDLFLGVSHPTLALSEFCYGTSCLTQWNVSSPRVGSCVSFVFGARFQKGLYSCWTVRSSRAKAMEGRFLTWPQSRELRKLSEVSSELCATNRARHWILKEKKNHFQSSGSSLKSQSVPGAFIHFKFSHPRLPPFFFFPQFVIVGR